MDEFQRRDSRLRSRIHIMSTEGNNMEVHLHVQMQRYGQTVSLPDIMVLYIQTWSTGWAVFTPMTVGRPLGPVGTSVTVVPMYIYIYVYMYICILYENRGIYILSYKYIYIFIYLEKFLCIDIAICLLLYCFVAIYNILYIYI